MRIFLTGRPGIGKSTVIEKVIDKARKEGMVVGGIVTPDIRERGRRAGFKVVDIHSGEEGILAHVSQEEGPKISKYRVNLKSFEEVALKALDFAIEESDLCIVDELGPMEFCSSKFKEKIKKIINSGKNLVATVHSSYKRRFKGEGRLMKVKKGNRDELPDRILRLLGKT